ncbi:4-(cytidine 5'-diphospho)-2-C-methyl-D-erythritol kinase [Pedobacter polaris]|uniref:4-diphosphocytidyl-2-C-methyl-D-erythritol kinase n=1 Tax=Pedobacter polaris TaxID=2571273 RepID=A0A4U1CSP5_9SPHI|nr:4-(cytidine 5'-diphospho)-2-C-methyl-D-erythritol kinase [Pedobacter polaris]TKC10783.1 4-(cytidine 5'-diphospho)-2-C-methyl-D-erythritol kinase [Pedobacter polaris]
MLAFANAKINLGLFLTEKRSDGYHNLETVFYPVNLYDVVELIDAAETSCIIKGIHIPGNVDDNICLKAFKILQSDFNLPHQKIVLLKNIPVGAGLGGGSADAAFLIKLVNEKFKLDLSVAKMQEYAKALGADCAFFIENKPAFAFAKGDEFADIKIDLSAYYIVLVKPEIHVSTAEAYSKVNVKHPSTSLKELIHLPLSEWKANIVNDFETSVFVKYPQIDEIKTKLYAAGAIFALMSGSGSSVYAIFEKAVKLPELEKDNMVFYGL